MDLVRNNKQNIEKELGGELGALLDVNYIMSVNWLGMF